MRKFLQVLFRSLIDFFFNLKIQSKLLFSFVSVFIVSILVVIFIFYNNWVRSLRTEAVNFSILYIRQLNENLNTYINELDRLTAMTLADSNVQNILGSKTENLTDVELKRNIEYMENFLFNMYTLKPDIKKIIVIGENRSLYVEGARPYTLFNVDPKIYSWYRKEVYETGRIKIYTNLPDESLVGRKDEEKSLSIVRQIRNTENNNLVGCIRIDIPFRKVEEIIKKIGENSSMKIVIMDSEYSAVFDPYHTMDQVNGSDYEKITKEFKNKSEGNIEIKTETREQNVVFDSSVYTKWIVMGLISNSDLLIETQKVRNASILIAIITIILIFLICLAISFGITNPLKRLSGSMKSVQEGNLDVKVRVLYSDEIGEISKSFNMMVAKINQLIKKEYLLELKNKEAELKELQAQINPHFLYNTLESLRMKALVNNDPEVAEMAKKVSLFYRLNIMKKGDIVPLTEELHHVKYYMDIQNMRFNNRFTYIEDLDEDILDAEILKLTLQPLVENAIFHGLEPKAGNAVIILRGWREDENIFIEIIDNGIGIVENQLDTLKFTLETSTVSGKLGIGILNVHNRIKLHFGEHYGLKIFSESGKGTKLVIHLPYATYGDGDKKC